MSVMRILNHKKFSNQEIHFGQFMQFVGTNADMKHHFGQIITWYFSKHKYYDAELEPFNFDDPLVEIDGEVVSRGAFTFISIQSINDLNSQLVMNKGSLIFQFFQQVFHTVDVEQSIAEVNDLLEKLALKISTDKEISKLSDGEVTFCVTPSSILFSDILQKYLDVNVEFRGLETPVEYLKGRDKFLLLLKILRKLLGQNSDSVFLNLRNFDDLLSYKDYLVVVEEIQKLVSDFPHFHCLLIPSQIGYVSVDEEFFEQITVFGDEIVSMESFNMLMQSINRHYPDAKVPTENEVLDYLKIVLPYLFSNDFHGVFFSVRQRVIKKLTNQLYGYFEVSNEVVEVYSELEKNYINNSNK